MLDDGELLLAVEAEPDECGRLVAICLVGFITLSLTVAGQVLISAYVYDSSPTSSRSTVAKFVVGLVAAAVAFCFWVLLMLVLGEWELGNPEGSRVVDALLSI